MTKKRRTFLKTISGVTGAAVIAGCTGSDDGNGTPSNNTDSRDDTGEENNTDDGENNTDVAEGDDGSESESDDTGNPELNIISSSIISHSNMFIDQQAEIEVENSGEGHAEEVELTVDWYQGDQYLDSTEVSREIFPADSQWVIRETPSLEEVDGTDRIEATITNFTPIGSLQSQKITIDGVELLAGDSIRARVETTNETNQEQSLVKIVALAHDSEGVIIGSEWTYPDWQAGGSKTLDLEIGTNGRTDQVDMVSAYAID